ITGPNFLNKSSPRECDLVDKWSTTPGWPSSMEGCERLSKDEVERAGDVPLIPSLLISGVDGAEILRWIGGMVAGDGWQGDVDASVYRIGT
ncbi:hypothetical protein M8C21_031354, partial [Ambrosia artemisiifolia]